LSLELLDVNCLINAGRNIETPFRLRVSKPGCGASDIEFVRILRLLPGKRIVALAKDQGRSVLVKTYLGRNAARNALREMSGIKLIEQAGVSTAGLLWEASLPGDGQLLAFEFLPNAIGLSEQLKKCEEQRTDILSSVMQIMSRLHSHGVIQKDIHLANFLLSLGEIYTIDGGGIHSRTTEPLSEQPSIDNLALFFAQFLARYDVLVPAVFSDYEEARGWGQDEGRLSGLQKEIARHRGLRKQAYIDKAFRDCTRFVCRSSFRRYMVCERNEYSDEMQAVLENPDKFIADGHSIKQGRTSTVALVHLQDRSLIIKRYNIKGVAHGLQRAFRKSRAWVSWSNAFRMEFLDIPSLKPIALLEDRIGPLRSKAYLITEYIEGPDALQCLREMEKPNGELEALANILYKLSESQISHGDLKATNFVMSNNGPVVIDLDAMREHKSHVTFAKAFKDDLERFMENWQDSPTLASRFQGLLSDLNDQYGTKDQRHR